MTQPIDWMAPITAPPSSPIYSPGAPLLSRSPFDGIREEQVRRARLLVAAAGGKSLTKGNVARVVSELAKAVPGLRYKVGRIVQTGLAPCTSLFGDDLPGREAGRPEEWGTERRAALLAMVEAKREHNEAPITDTAILRLIIADWRKRGGHPPSLKTLQNQLAASKVRT